MSDNSPKPRTATDVILSLESKIDQLMQVHRTLDMNVKILSNKFNQLMEIINEPVKNENFAVPLNNLYSNDDEMFFEREPEEVKPVLPMTIDTSPVGFRKTSRPETFGGLVQQQKNVPTPSLPIPAMTSAKVADADVRLPVIQRVVDKNGKAVFMADVEIVNIKDRSIETKTRTNGVGKWQAALPYGEYQVTLKQKTSSKDKIEVMQTLQITSNTPSELQTLIIK